MSTPTTPAPRTKQQIGSLAYEIFEAIKAAEFTYDELVHFGHSVYSKVTIEQLRVSAKDPRVGVGVLTKLFRLAEILDGKFPLPVTPAIPVEPPAPIAPAIPVANGHTEAHDAHTLIARAVAGAPGAPGATSTPVINPQQEPSPGTQENSGG